MKVCYVFRDSQLQGNSIEEIFNGIADYLERSSFIEKKYFFYDEDLSVLHNIINSVKRIF